MDTDAAVLKEAAAAVLSIDLRYRKADALGQRAMRADRDVAFSAYAKARRRLLAEGVVCTTEDVRTMQALRDDVRRARNTQSLLIASGRVAKFLLSL